MQHDTALHVLANALVEYETLTAEEIKRILVPYSEVEQQEEEEVEEEELVLA